MFREYIVNVAIWKGASRTSRFTKEVHVALDDLPDELTEAEVKDLVNREVDSQLCRTEDYPQYGKNWEIVDYNAV